MYGVKDVTINRIVNWVKQDVRRGCDWTIEELRQLGYKAPSMDPTEEVDIHWVVKLARDIALMNYRTVKVSWGGLCLDWMVEGSQAYDFTYDPHVLANTLRAYKSMQCLLDEYLERWYFNTDPLYQWLKRLSHHMADEIVIRLPEYKKLSLE